MDQFQPYLQLPKPKIKKPIASAKCDQIPKMGQIICFYVNTHDIIKSRACDFVVLKHSAIVHIQIKYQQVFVNGPNNQWMAGHYLPKSPIGHCEIWTHQDWLCFSSIWNEGVTVLTLNLRAIPKFQSSIALSVLINQTNGLLKNNKFIEVARF